MLQTKSESISFFEQNTIESADVKKTSGFKKAVVLISLMMATFIFYSFFNKDDVTVQQPRVLTMEDMAIKKYVVDEQAIRQKMIEGQVNIQLGTHSGNYIVNNRLDDNLDTAKTNADFALSEAYIRLRNFNNSVNSYSQQMETNLRK